MRERASLKTRFMIPLALMLVWLCVGYGDARQVDTRERDGLRRKRPAAAAPLLLAPSDRQAAPAIPNQLAWIQGDRPRDGSLDGKVVLVEFWDFTRADCLRVAPLVQELNSRYTPSGLVVIGVHAPEFSFASESEAVAAAVKRLGLTYAVVSDPEMRAWHAFDNNGWPSAFLIDAHGRLAWRGLGEDEHTRLEERIRALLHEAGQEQLPAPSHAAAPLAAAPAADQCGEATLDVYLGHARGSLANAQGYAPGATRIYAPTGEDPPEGLPLLEGPWVARAEGVSRGPGGSSSMILVYRASEVYAVLRTLTAGPHSIDVIQDGVPLSAGLKGADVAIDTTGRSFVTVDRPGLYIIVSNPKTGEHRIELRPRDEQVQIVAMTFGNSCQAPPAPR